MKKNHLIFSGLIVAVVTAASVLPGGFDFVAKADTQPVTSFRDVAANTAVFAAAGYLKNKGIIGGYTDGNFKPEQTITRAEALKVTLKALEILKKIQPDSGVTTPKKTFSDVKKTDWFYSFVEQGASIQLIQGYPDGTFQPQNQINVAESLKLVTRGFAVELKSLPLADEPYVDVGNNLWFSALVEFSKSKHLLPAQDDGKFHVEREISRGDFAILIYRLLYLQEQHLDTFPLKKDWPVFTHPSSHFGLAYPFDWQKIELSGQTIFWKQDLGNKQLSFARIYPNSATVTATIDLNQDGLSLEKYIQQLQYDANVVIKNSKIGNYNLTSIEINPEVHDYYFELPNKTFLILYAQSGKGPLKEQLLTQIGAMLESVVYNEAITIDKESFLSDLRSKILLQGKGKEVLAAFTDLKIIETDTIGIGTGPVDYYYSLSYDVTIKYERNSQTTLGIKVGKTTAF